MKIMMDNERHRRQFEEVREECPWRILKQCRPTKYSYTQTEVRECKQINCPIFHFKKFFERE